jgi:muramoyltetrapeptide carboxypeptidase
MTEPLKKGDLFQVVAASSPISNTKDLKSGIKVLQEWGLICNHIDAVDRSWGYLAGQDEVRFNELHSNNNYPLIAFARGGWGSARLLEKKQPWKEGWMLGFSDLTSILLARLTNGFHGGIHGPLITTLGAEPEWSKNRLKSILFGNYVPDIFGDPWGGGISKGQLIVGNLTVLTHLIGTQYLPNFKNSILIIEDIGEAPYRIDRMLTQLRLSGILQQLSGLGFGSFANCDDDIDVDKTKSFELYDIFRDRTQGLKIPIVSNLPIGHGHGNASLPIGSQAILDGDKGRLTLSF